MSYNLYYIDNNIMIMVFWYWKFTMILVIMAVNVMTSQEYHNIIQP